MDLAGYMVCGHGYGGHSSEQHFPELTYVSRHVRVVVLTMTRDVSEVAQQQQQQQQMMMPYIGPALYYGR